MSGRKNFLNKFKAIEAGDMSQATVTSEAINIQGMDDIGVQGRIVSGTPTGTLGVEISANYDQHLGTGNWVAITQTTPAIPVAITTGSPADIYIDLTLLSAPWIRIVYTKTSGTGSLDAYIVGKML